MNYRYVAVDVTRSTILLVGETLQDLNKQLLSEQLQRLIHKKAVWMNSLDADT